MSNGEWITKVSAAGHLPGQVRRGFDDLVRAFAGKRVRIKLSPYRKQRSQNQNRFLWGVVYPMIVDVFRESGNNVDVDDVHSYCKEYVGKLKQVFVTPNGEVLTGPGSTAKLGTQEFEVYVERIRVWAAETLGISVPLPHEEINQPTEEEDHDETRPQ